MASKNRSRKYKIIEIETFENTYFNVIFGTSEKTDKVLQKVFQGLDKVDKELIFHYNFRAS